MAALLSILRPQVNLAWALNAGKTGGNPMHFVTCLKVQIRRAILVASSFLALLCTLTDSFAAVTFTTSLDRNSVVLGEQVTLTLTFQGGQPQQISQLPAIEGLRVASSVSQSMNTSTGPSGTTTVFTYSLALEPMRVGEFTIPALQAVANGENLSSAPLHLKVTAEDASAPPATLASQPVFLWPVLPKTELFVGETMLAEIRLYVRSDVRRIGDVQIPIAGDGLTFSELNGGQSFQRRLGNTVFTIVPYTFAITPLKTGDLRIGPISGSAMLNPPSMMDFDSLFGQTRAQRAALSLEPIALRVQPLPSAGVPASFSGAVGQFNFSVTAGPTNVASGDPITVRVQISGKGQLDVVNLPEYADWHDFKTYPPTSQTKASNPFGTEGTKVFEQVVVPQNAEVRQLPPFSFSYFDPEQKAYRTVSQPGIPLTIRPTGSTPAPTVAGVQANDQETSTPQDVVPIKQRLGHVATAGPMLIQRPWVLGLNALPLLFLAGAMIWRRREQSFANNPRLRRQRLVAQRIRDGLNQLRHQANANDSDGFFATVFRLLQEQLGERLDLPASSITEAVIEDRLRPAGLPEDTLARLHALFQSCNMARYAPVKSSQELSALIPEVEMALGDIKKWEL
jgi:hypothetical protein